MRVSDETFEARLLADIVRAERILGLTARMPPTAQKRMCAVAHYEKATARYLVWKQEH